MNNEPIKEPNESIEVSKVKMTDGNTYNFKDLELRERVRQLLGDKALKVFDEE